MMCVTIPPFSIFVRHAHLQHVGAGRRGMSFLGYHLYFILSLISLKDAMAVAYGRFFSIRPCATQTTDDEEVLATVHIPEK